MRTLLIALLFSSAILGHADDPLVSNWIWQLPPARDSLGTRSNEEFRTLLSRIRVHDPYGNGIPYPHQLSVMPPKRNGVEAAEAINALRMERYRKDCETLKQGEMQGIPTLYPSAMPFLEKHGVVP